MVLSASFEFEKGHNAAVVVCSGGVVHNGGGGESGGVVHSVGVLA